MSSTQRTTETVNTHNDDNVPQGMLSSPHIKYCFLKYGIVKDYDLKGLRAATYDMRIGGKTLTWDKGEKKEYILKKIADTNNSNIVTSIDLRPNSLTFVTTIEKFNLPKDIIARFNLKSKWVHKGLLLGTGPIVDPEFSNRLLIPMHNFSSKDITLDYGEEFISVEFTKTLDPDAELEIGSDICKYVPNRSSSYDFDKYLKKIANDKTESSVLSTLNYQNEVFGKYNSRLNLFSWGGGLALFSLIIGIVMLVYASWDLWATSVTTSTQASNLVKEYKNTATDFSVFALNSATGANENLILQLREDFNRLDERYKLIASPTAISDLNNLKARVSELEIALKRPATN